jgi:chromosome segregation ATPase
MQALIEKTAALNTITDQFNAQRLANEELLSVTNKVKQKYDNKIAEQEARVDSEVALYRSTELARATQEVQDTIKALSDTSEQLQADIVRMQGQQSQLQQAITEKTATLEDLSGKISSAQTTIQTLLGA